MTDDTTGLAVPDETAVRALFPPAAEGWYDPPGTFPSGA
jgi:hypothetical protein